MDIEDIKSPLPPRAVNIPEPETEMQGNQPELETKTTEETPIIKSISSSQPIKKGFDLKNLLNKKQLLMFGGIGLAVILIFILIFKVLVPTLSKNGGRNVTLNYWGLWEDSSVINGIIADYEAKNPGVKIKYTRQQKNDYRTRLAGRLAKTGQTEEEVPDIFRIHSSWLPMFKDALAPVPVATVANLKLDTDFFEVYKKDLKLGNNFMAVPLMYDGLALFYNKDLIDSAQIELPKTWWNLNDAAMKLTVKDEVGNIKIAGAALGLADNVDHWSDVLGLMAKQNGVNFLVDNEENNKKIQDVLTFYTLFVTKSQVWNLSLPSSTELFANGKLGFYFAPSWRAFNIQEMNPNLKFEITTVPQLPVIGSLQQDQTNTSELTDIYWSTYWAEGVNSQSKKQKEAWKFLEYLASKETLEKMFAAQSQIRSFGEIYPRKSMAQSLVSNEMIKPFIAKADQSEGWYLSSRTFDDGVNDEMIKYFADAVNAIAINGRDPGDVIGTLRSGINQMIQKYQLKK